MVTVLDLRCEIKKLDPKANVNVNKPALVEMLKKLKNKGNTAKVQSMIKQVKAGIAQEKEDEDMPMGQLKKKSGTIGPPKKKNKKKY